MNDEQIEAVIMPNRARAPDPATLEKLVDAAARQIPPHWPLNAQVAVNPFLGQAGERLAEAGARLARAGGVPVAMPRPWYLERIAAGTIGDADLSGALAASPHTAKPEDVDALKAAAAAGPRSTPQALPTCAELAAEASGTDWPHLINDRFGVWAGGFADQGQALWQAPREKRAWSTFRLDASHDLTPEIIGLVGFAAFVADAPERPMEAIGRAVGRLGLEAAALPAYFHRLYLSLGGWAQYARYRLWQAELAQTTDPTLTDFLAIRLLWEEALYTRHGDAIAEVWAEARSAYAAPLVPNEAEIVDEILQEAAERAAQRRLGRTLAAPATALGESRPLLQAAFCIDVRSEIFRRALEGVDPAIRTLGFAGFFGIFTSHRRFASDLEERRLPVLLNPTARSSATGPATEAADRMARYRARARRAWTRFKLAAVSSFAFVEAMGPVYIGKLVRDALGLDGKRPTHDPKPRFDPEPDLETRIDSAANVLRAMSLTHAFARLVLLAGHGAEVANNPHASALQCGACGGYSGEVNARLLASLLNDRAVRRGLVRHGIAIPDDTLFLAGRHDTTTDTLTLYEGDTDATAHAGEIAKVRAWLAAAGQIARGERALRLPRAGKAEDLPERARNWAEVRPEWGLAGCKAFIAAPRARTVGRNLEGTAFLHDYDWTADKANGFSVLELIMTAPVVVASWISLQYYGSTVAPDTFGSGNKVLHNVVGGMGVFEGNGGPLRAGLPWQSIHDGERLIHEPLRLSVCIEAPREAMTEILKRHDDVRALFDNRWLHLFALDEKGRMAWRYTGHLAWQATSTEPESTRVLSPAL